MSLSQQNKFQAGTSTAAGVLDFPDVKPIPFEGIFKDKTHEMVDKMDRLKDLLYALKRNTLQFGGTGEGKADENMDEIIEAIKLSIQRILRLVQKVEKYQKQTCEDEKESPGAKGSTSLEPFDDGGCNEDCSSMVDFLLEFDLFPK